MSSGTDQFQRLRRLLAVKKHEQPPPGFFDGFSRDVIARIKAGEQHLAWYEEIGWIQRVRSMFETKPVFAGVFGAAVCALLVAGFVSSEQMETEGNIGLVTGPAQDDAPVATLVAENSTQVIVPATNTLEPSLPSLFDQYQLSIGGEPGTVPASFEVRGALAPGGQ